MKQIHLVITIAGKREWCSSLNLATYDCLKKKYTPQKNNKIKGVLLVITGLGPKNSKNAALFILKELNAKYVLNIGTAGRVSETILEKEWYHINQVYPEEHTAHPIQLDDRLPLFWPQELSKHNTSLQSLYKPLLNQNTALKAPLVDMEAAYQAEVFKNSSTSFAAIKFVSDSTNALSPNEYKKSLKTYQKDLQKIFSFYKLQEPKISVIIPTYNREKQVNIAIDSVLNQDYIPHEIIVVNDGSSDTTAHRLDHYARGIDGIGFQAIHHRSQEGVSAARNTGVKHSSGDWIAFLDSDDYWESSKLDDQVSYLEHYPFYHILQSEETWIRNGKFVNACKHHKKPCGWAFDESLLRCLISPSSVLLSKTLFETVGGFNETLMACEDYDLWLKILRHLPVGKSNEKNLIKIGGEDDQLSNTPLLDWYRVLSLQQLLYVETNPYYQEKIGAVLNQKLDILKKGAKKHKNKELLEKLNTLQINTEMQ